MARHLSTLACAFAGLTACELVPSVGLAQSTPTAPVFQTSHECLACHNGLAAPSGEDVSIGTAWRGSMMAHAARDPYWLAGVRRETVDHPAASVAIEDECSICHMPMTSVVERFGGGQGRIFAHLPAGQVPSATDRLAQDGASCSACHQIRGDKLGTRDSFTGGFVVAGGDAKEPRPLYGPRAVVAGLAAVMRSATGFTPTETEHVRQSELCASCHTLITHALGPKGEVVGELPEQVPYLEWRHSAYREERSCQSCHMPAVQGATAIASVLAEPRSGLARHTFVGGNTFMLRMLNRHRSELGIEALPQELESAALATSEQLRSAAASLSVARAELSASRIEIDVVVSNRAGHKLPTGYPSRRAWLHLTVTDAGRRTVFESGAVGAGGRIMGNDNDADARAFEPHYREIHAPDEVQIYEAIMAEPSGAVTTGLLRATRYLKDNRLLPRGFDKATADAEVRVLGDAMTDGDFDGQGDLVRYVVDPGLAPGPFQVEAELLYQTIAFRWADNLRRYDTPETRRFVSFHEPMAAMSVATLARDAAEARGSR